MNFVIENNVLCQVHTQALAAAGSIRLKPLAGVPPWKLPPNVTALSPNGTITLMDRLDSSAAKIEIVRYSARTDNGDGTYTYTLLRGQEGTTAKQWEVGEYAVQIPTARGLYDGIDYDGSTLKAINQVYVNSTGSMGIGTIPTVVPSTGNPVVGAHNLIMYNAGNLGLTMLTDIAATRTQQIGFGSEGVSLFDAGMVYNNTARVLSLFAAGGARTQVDTSGNLIPAADNAYSCGKTGARWTAVWAVNGTIQTSDARDKVDVADSPLGLAFVNALRPVAWRWSVGGNDVTIEEVPEAVTEQETIEEERPELRIEIVDGVPVRRLITERVAVPQFDHVGVLNEAGQPLRDGDGKQFTHPVPRMRTVTRLVKREKLTPRAGKRVHYGLIAQEVKAAVDAAGVDFGGFVQVDPADPASEMALRYDQFVAPLIAAVQELTARLRAIESRLPPSEGAVVLR